MARAQVSGVSYIVTFVALIVLALASFAASRLHLGAWGVVISLVIAVAKSALVVLFFMHLVEERFSNRAVVLVSFLLIVIFIAITCLDVATRHTFPVAPEARITVRASHPTVCYKRRDRSNTEVSPFALRTVSRFC